MTEENRISIAAGGDILITKRIPDNNPGVEPIREYLARADLRVANLETTITDGTCYPSAYSGGTWLTSDPSCLKDVQRYGFDLLALSNNHTMDYSYPGLEMTEQYVENYGFSHAGSGKNLYEAARPAMIETGHGRIGVIDLCSTFVDAARAGAQTSRMQGRPGLNPLRFHTVYRVTKEHAEWLNTIGKVTKLNALREKHRAQGFITPLKEGVTELGTLQFEIVESEQEEGRYTYPDQRDLDRTIAGIKEAEQTCEAVIVMIHSHEIKADEEYEADYFLETFARACIDAGAAAVIGSGTHQIKGIEFYRDRPIFYCLGNFIFENEYVRDLPADYMEKYGLDPNTSGADGIAFRSAQARQSLYSVKEVYQTILPYFELTDGKCTHVELLPVSLGRERKRFEKNLPYPAEEKEAQDILEYLNRACRPYGNSWILKDGKFVRA